MRSEGCAVVVLKRLRDAEKSSDRILGIIKGSAVNQDGASNGLTAPNPESQRQVIEQAIRNANVDNNSIDFVEAHGTGTELGDPIEVEVLDSVYGQREDQDHPIYVGAVKSNIGHTEAAAGLMGLIKILKMFEYEQILGNSHLKKLNPKINLKKSALRIERKGKAWKTIGKKRRAGLSSFGFSGTNAHVVLEEAPEASERIESEHQRTNHLLVLSAKGEQALDAHVDQYISYLDNAKDLVGDICYTAGVGRAHFDDRLVVVGQTTQEIKAKLKAKDFVQNKIANQNTPKVAWLFTGQGAQRIKLGYELYETHPVFKQAIDHCSDHLKTIHDYDYKTVWQSEDQDLIAQTQHTQIILFVIEYALAKLWQSFGIHPDCVCGHSVGEYVSAVIAGVMSLEDGLTLIYHRGHLMQSLPSGGGMLV